jgi:hypothetical protein
MPGPGVQSNASTSNGVSTEEALFARDDLSARLTNATRLRGHFSNRTRTWQVSASRRSLHQPPSLRCEFSLSSPSAGACSATRRGRGLVASRDRHSCRLVVCGSEPTWEVGFERSVGSDPGRGETRECMTLGAVHWAMGQPDGGVRPACCRSRGRQLPTSAETHVFHPVAATPADRDGSHYVDQSSIAD